MRKIPAALGLAVVLGAFADAAQPGAGGSPGRTATSEQLARFFDRTKGMTRVVPASDVWESLHAGRSRYLVVDVRPADEYAKGHVPGAISIPVDVLFLEGSLAKLPSGRTPMILLVCQSGHVESMALGGLAALGYEPYVMRFGMIGWNAETRVKAGAPGQEPDTVRGVGGPIER
ncbi:rhodanese-like domain-containing protein [Anaeromyxobacter sp. Fw109-5]|uniref:rhodanese-like domain-containing protein n=1 Tax=Anaeromyxobacter sp. (strain Fw109-5) TaxID=404589 RepID=UPI000158A53D|nr:rhodanese-like domain-containing protein [Anaeromyxobacter sp. Fw109-5]ABS27057.1 Rhodanese domain protein [Anaeromyxobacter sp. Fw109-5]